MSILIAEQVSKAYGQGEAQTTVLNRASLRVNHSEFVTILGPSGSGKSTLLNLCGLIETPDSGEIIHQHQRISELNAKQRTEFRRAHIGFIFQSFNLVPVMSVVDNVAYPLMLLDWPAQKIRQRVLETLDQVGLLAFADKKPEQLSGGQCQRVAVARALVKKPSLIVADEPTASLDSETAIKVIGLMKQLAQEQATACLIATHDARLLPYSDAVLHVDQGGIVQDNATVQQRTSQSMEGVCA